MWPAGGGATTNIGPAKSGRLSRSKKSKEPREAASSGAGHCTSSQDITRATIPATMDVDSSITPQCPTLHSRPLPPLQFNLRDLLELEESGERVVWPTGFNAVTAAAYVANYDLAINIGSLYTQRIEEDLTEESTPIQAIHTPSCISAEESPEPGPLPQVSGSSRDNTVRTAFTPSTRPRRRCITLREYESRQ